MNTTALDFNNQTQHTITDNWSISLNATGQREISVVNHMTTLEPSSSDADIDVYHVRSLLMLYVSPFLIIPGVVGNILSFVVLQSRFYRRAPSSFILSTLACLDSGVLLTGLLRHWIIDLTMTTWKNGLYLDVRALTEASCKIHVFLTYYLPQLSSWSLVLMTLERLASVTAPFKAKEIFSRRRMILGWVIMAILLAGLCTHFFKINTLHFIYYKDAANVTQTFQYCKFHESHADFFLGIWPWIDMTVISLLPFTVILISNIVIITLVIRSKKLRAEKMPAKEDESRSITTMLIAISIMFLLTTTPVSIYFIGNPYWPDETLYHKRDQHIAYAICNLLYYVSNSTNFLMYCVTGTRFRRAVAIVVCCRQEERRIVTGDSTVMTTVGRDATIRNNRRVSESQVTVNTVA